MVPGGRARAVHVSAGETVRVVNTHGTQVVDFWAIRADRPEIALSMQHSRIRWRNLRPKPGDEMLDEERATMLTMVEDTSPGVHDTVIAACDPFRYAQLGAPPDHRSCCTNFAEALAELSIARATPVPAPLNLFMNIPWDTEGNITFEPTVSAAGRQRAVPRRGRRRRDRVGLPDGHRADQRTRRWGSRRRRTGPVLSSAST